MSMTLALICLNKIRDTPIDTQRLKSDLNTSVLQQLRSTKDQY